MELFNQLIQWVLQLLPKSPFIKFINLIGNIPYLKYLNWFFPVAECIAVMEAFLAVVAVWYIYQAVLRWIHLIK